MACRFSALKPPGPELPTAGLITALWYEHRPWEGTAMKKAERTERGRQGGRGLVPLSEWAGRGPEGNSWQKSRNVYLALWPCVFSRLTKSTFAFRLGFTARNPEGLCVKQLLSLGHSQGVLSEHQLRTTQQRSGLQRAHAASAPLSLVHRGP